ncbi:hypothetical protein C3B44_02620 [Corynebacterium yudongzhengii]|uniref:DUF4282 domain-containing protein n=1 Tax=Corynebacterium yudongzhengii TaxID=2080740 RepID=A0A2U1T774_9CORY|nr:DUF4282 domain-containing protein [Corynebacterium yudongzhengii]AWB81382.1 hypothetical protein C3B44_02620 [Corynebacterium yudongzhengii]PWC01825.1 DUF4282 domain-containing protein [Corynebacterium yudongzhengii]
MSTPHNPENNPGDNNEGAAPWGSSDNNNQFGYGQQPYPSSNQQSSTSGSLQPYGDNSYNVGQANQKKDAKGFFSALFDFNFETFIALKWAKFIYILGTIAIALSTLFVGIAAWLVPVFAAGALGILWFLVGWIVPVIWGLLQLIGLRLLLEFVIAIVRTAESTTQTAKNTAGN